MLIQIYRRNKCRVAKLVTKKKPLETRIGNAFKSCRNFNRPIRKRSCKRRGSGREPPGNRDKRRGHEARRKNNGDRASLEVVYYENRTMCRRS